MRVSILKNDVKTLEELKEKLSTAINAVNVVIELQGGKYSDKDRAIVDALENIRSINRILKRD